MNKFVPISSVGEDAVLSPEFYVEAQSDLADFEGKGGLVPLLPPLDHVGVVANSTLLALFDSEMAKSPKGTSFVLIEAPKAARTQASSPARLGHYVWTGSSFETREQHIGTRELAGLLSLIEEEGILSKHGAEAGIMGAIPSLSSVLASVEAFPLDMVPLFKSFNFYQWEPSPGIGSFSEAVKNVLDEWLEKPIRPDLILRKDQDADTESLGESLLVEYKSNPRAAFISASPGTGKTAFTQAWQNYLPGVALVRYTAKAAGTDFCLAFMSPNLARDTLVQFMEAFCHRLKQQQSFLQRCWEIIGTEISSRVRHMFKNRIGSAYDEIQSINRAATENGWLSMLTESPDLIKAQKELHHDADDYYQVGAHLHRIRQTLNSLERAVDQLSKFYKGFQGSPELVSVNLAIETQLANWRAARPDVEIRKELDPVDPVCRIVPGALAEILDNIFVNAKKFIPPEPGHHLFVTTRLSQDKIVVIIANDGPSELPEHPTKLFVTTDPHGYGVGLNLVEKLVSAANGTFSISARPDEPGVLNRIELPNPKWKEN